MVFSLTDSISSVEPAEWDALLSGEHNPFLGRGWLNAFEASGSISPETGWQPIHLLGYPDAKSAAAKRNPVYALPLYLKSHSWGEFVFDFAWADVASQLGQEYYPKAVAVVPATPVTAYRELNPGGDSGLLSEALAYLEPLLKSMGVKSLSFLFAEDDFADRLETLGFHRWIHQGFVWTRDDMTSFDDYLGWFNKNQRRNIRRERRSLGEENLEVRISSGNELSTADADDMFDLYEKTNDQFGPWAAKFLNREFFQIAFRDCSDQILLVSAHEEGGEAVGRSMLVKKDRRLYGRYWGARRYLKDLHFNLCYYDPIDYALNHSIDYFDPGMGGEHKIRRGFHAVGQYSMHRFFDFTLDRVFEENIGQLNRRSLSQINFVNESLPQRHI